MRNSAILAISAESRGNLRPFCGKFGASTELMLASFRKETSMTRPVIPLCAGPIPDRLSHLDSLIATAEAELAAAEAEVDAATTAIKAVEPHPHAHGYTAGEDCIYAGLGHGHFLPLAGLLAQPWPEALGMIVRIQQQHGFDYLLKAIPAAIAEFGDTLIDHGAELLDARSDHIEQDLRELFERKPVVAIGLVWRLFGFHNYDHLAWLGIFASGDSVSSMIESTGDIGKDVSLGDALASTVVANHTLLTEIGKEELRRRAARRDVERQASWAEVPQAYRDGGSWRGLAPTRRQRHLMQRIEAARSLPMTATGRRGDTSDAIERAGGNPRFPNNDAEEA